MSAWARSAAPVAPSFETQWNGAEGIEQEDGPRAVAALEAALAARREAVRMSPAPEPVGGAIAAAIARDAAETSEMEIGGTDGSAGAVEHEGEAEMGPFVGADFGDVDEDAATIERARAATGAGAGVGAGTRGSGRESARGGAGMGALD